MLWVAPVGKWTDEESVVWLSKLWKQQGSPATWTCLTGALAAMGQGIIGNCIYLKPVQNLWAVTTSLYLSLLKRETFLFVLEFNYSYYISDKSYQQDHTWITINTFTSSCWASIFFPFYPSCTCNTRKLVNIYPNPKYNRVLWTFLGLISFSVDKVKIHFLKNNL